MVGFPTFRALEQPHSLCVLLFAGASAVSAFYPWLPGSQAILVAGTIRAGVAFNWCLQPLTKASTIEVGPPSWPGPGPEWAMVETPHLQSQARDTSVSTHFVMCDAMLEFHRNRAHTPRNVSRLHDASTRERPPSPTHKARSVSTRHLQKVPGAAVRDDANAGPRIGLTHPPNGCGNVRATLARRFHDARNHAMTVMAVVSKPTHATVDEPNTMGFFRNWDMGHSET